MQPVNIAPRDRLIVALDLPTWLPRSDDRPARRQRDILQDRLSARLCRRLPLVRQLARSSKKVFVDLKLHDIGNTVARASRASAQLGATFLTVARLSANHEGGGRGTRRIGLENPRRHGADLL